MIPTAEKLKSDATVFPAASSTTSTFINHNILTAIWSTTSTLPTFISDDIVINECGGALDCGEDIGEVELRPEVRRGKMRVFFSMWVGLHRVEMSRYTAVWRVTHMSTGERYNILLFLHLRKTARTKLMEKSTSLYSPGFEITVLLGNSWEQGLHNRVVITLVQSLIESFQLTRPISNCVLDVFRVYLFNEHKVEIIRKRVNGRKCSVCNVNLSRTATPQ